jgi:WD40 repeat protein
MRHTVALCVFVNLGLIVKAAEPKLVRTFEGHTDDVNGVAFYPDGKTLATASDDKTVRLWNVETGEEQKTLLKHDRRFLFLVAAQDGAALAVSDSFRDVRVWKKGSKEPITFALGSAVHELAISPDGKFLAPGPVVWELATEKEAELRGAVSRSFCLAFSPNGKRIAAISSAALLNLPGAEGPDWAERKVVGIWDLDGKLRETLSPPDIRIMRALAYAPNGISIAVSGSDARGKTFVGTWDVHSGKGHWLPDVPRVEVGPLAFSPNGRLLAGASAAGFVTLWDLRTHKKYATLSGNEATRSGLAFSPDGRWLAAAGSGNTVNLWELPEEYRGLAPPSNSTWLAAEGGLRCLALRPDGKELAVGGDDGSLLVWEIGKEEPRLTLQRRGKAILAVAYSPDGKTLLSAERDDWPRLWDLRTGKEQATLTRHKGQVLCVAFASDGKTLVTGASDGSVRLWNSDGSARRTLAGHEASVRGLVFTPDGKSLLTGSSDGTIKQWDPIDDGKPKELLKSEHGVAALALTRDGKTLFAANSDATVTRLDLAAGTSRRLVKNGPELIQGLAVSPDGKTLALCSRLDETVRRYDAADGKELPALDWHTAWVSGLAFSADGKVLASAGMDGAVRLWRMRAEADK